MRSLTLAAAPGVSIQRPNSHAKRVALADALVAQRPAPDLLRRERRERVRRGEGLERALEVADAFAG